MFIENDLKLFQNWFPQFEDSIQHITQVPVC